MRREEDPTKHLGRGITALTTAALALAACANGAPGGTDATSIPVTTSQSPAGSGTVITTYASDFGEILFDEPGQTIYLFDAETTSKPACYDACAAAWPPVLTVGAPRVTGRATEQIKPELLGTTTRTDGGTQVTYAGHPLYYYAHEGKRQVLCHNVREFGGVWLVIQPDGEPAP